MVTFSASDHAMMARAIRNAERGRGIASPNPHVGCVIVKSGRVIGEGWTQFGGRPHAEAMALAACVESPQGATVYTTLEPCSPHPNARGPACANLLVEAGVARVVSALHDPFAGVDGAGHARLKAVGIQLDIGCMETVAAAQLQGYLSRVSRGRPWVTLKVANTLDGKTALLNGQSQWITAEDARRDVHLARLNACAVMTGIGTALVDDPALTVRDLPPGVCAQRQPLRILLDSRLEVRDDMQLVTGVAQGLATLVVTTSGCMEREMSLRAQGVEVLRVPPDPLKGKVDLVAMMSALATWQTRGLNEILVETGAKMNASLLAAGVVDEILFYVAPTLFGDKARGLFALPEMQALTQRIELELTDVRQVGHDLRVRARVGGVNV